MDIVDKTRLTEIVAADTRRSDHGKYDVASPERMAAAAKAVLAHADQFNLDGSDEATLPADTYIASLIVDLLVLAEKVGDNSAASVVEHLPNFLDGTGISIRGITG